MASLNKLLVFLREKRAFDADNIFKAKIEAINNFFTNEGLDACVVGLSGGIDSALVLSLLSEASLVEGSPIKKIMGLILPIYGNGTSNQTNAKDKAFSLSTRIELKNKKVTCGLKDLTFAYESYADNNATAFANGQLASIVRTPMLYYEAAMLQDEGYKSIVVGTTNRDEGAYIGFFGKASDGMVDLQPIGDLHKSEVYELSKRLNVPQSIIDATPAGDVYDGRVDEEMIGAPYWFLELYQLYLQYYNESDASGKIRINNFFSLFTEEDKAIWKKWKNNIESLHKKNLHKYKVGSPSRYIDVLPRQIIK